jgi:hypothetical protein
VLWVLWRDEQVEVDGSPPTGANAKSELDVREHEGYIREAAPPPQLKDLLVKIKAAIVGNSESLNRRIRLLNYR